MRDVYRIQPEPGTELFSSTKVLPDGIGDKWQLGFGPVDGAGAAWVLYRRGRDGARTARKLLGASFPSRARLYVWLARTTGPRHAAEMLRTIGPLEDFYRRYAGGRPDLAPPRASRWSAIMPSQRAPRSAAQVIGAPKSARRLRLLRSTPNSHVA